MAPVLFVLLWIVAPLATILAWSAGHRLTGWAVVVATLVALMGLTADAASADEGERPVRMENVEPATDGLLLAATEAGAIVWRLQGKSPCEPAVFVYDEVYADTGEPTEAPAARTAATSGGSAGMSRRSAPTSPTTAASGTSATSWPACAPSPPTSAGTTSACGTPRRA
jgi:hypothetical protein